MEYYDQEKRFEIKHSKIELQMKKAFIHEVQLRRFDNVEDAKNAKNATWEDLHKGPLPKYWIRLMDDYWVSGDINSIDNSLLKIVGTEELVLSPNLGKNGETYGSRMKINPDLVINHIPPLDLVGILGVAVEYDGNFWHKGKEGKDIKKTIVLLNNNYVVIRFRENPLSFLPITNHRFKENLMQIEFNPESDSFDNYLPMIFEFIDEKMDIISRRRNQEINKLLRR